jgi:hypothetical protein
MKFNVKCIDHFNDLPQIFYGLTSITILISILWLVLSKCIEKIFQAHYRKYKFEANLT